MRFFQIEPKGNVIHLRLNRGEKYNALHVEMLQEFAEAVTVVKEHKAQVVVISGTGQGFCAGGDLKMMKEIGDSKIYEQVMNDIETVVTTIYNMPKVVIAALHGPVVGLGLSIALAADYIMADANARISMNFIGIGLVPDGGGHFFLEQRLGVHHAKHLTWQGQEMRAKEAFDHKLVDIVVARNIHEEADQLAWTWSQRPLKSMIATKEIYHQYKIDQLLQYMAKERQAQWTLRTSEDHKEGVSAFLEKRKPDFNGN
ncbi:enoyl-CoA hydratase [Halobacillus shinanisalinarum]|uniref:Enoyl-CoA hydratase n=1 Tax=Halobacillus shinanisalinarum TaxID=2932258 RepID=A0ABY4GXT4_9BACI|nr:enoyl-CoA hydratase [Halobacillus shinanisalinarum]UOQ92730.1 enoyl-CoA hydratase [Halobacillus shinanisalinarum]